MIRNQNYCEMKYSKNFNLKNKKAITPIITLSLLLFVSVLAFSMFQGWFIELSSGIIVDSEAQMASSALVDIEGFYGENLYLSSNGDLVINSIEVNDIDCNFNGSISGFKSINVSSCLENVSGVAQILLVTNLGIFESSKFVDNISVVE